MKVTALVVGFFCFDNSGAIEARIGIIIPKTGETLLLFHYL